MFDMPEEKVVMKDEYGKKWIEHIVKEGARFHVIWWDSKGSHCSEPNCIINRR